MKIIFVISMLLLVVMSARVSAQEKFTLSGFVRDSESGEELLQANISIPKTSSGVVTNEYGFYSFTVAKGSYSVRFSYLGYKTFETIISLDKNIRLDVALQPSSVELNEIVVTGRREDANVKSTGMGVVSVDIKEAKLIPVLFGEQDVLKMIQLLPGVSPNSEGGSGFFVRGGDTDQNLVLLDEAPVYNTSHLLGFFSVFNSDALKDVKLYKGAFPAQFGGRISSVLDIRMKNGNSKSWESSGGIGLISSRITVEGPLSSDNGSIIISGRRTYADLVLKTISSDFSDFTLYFYDLNLKANYNVGDKDRFY
ncbi:MAG: TonB-dependent receptor, partial [Ignavibacteriaceae bacterium]|nr:TonB-dependent receptor [Ignavibacteriaceae bacterium]